MNRAGIFFTAFMLLCSLQPGVAPHVLNNTVGAADDGAISEADAEQLEKILSENLYPQEMFSGDADHAVEHWLEAAWRFRETAAAEVFLRRAEDIDTSDLRAPARQERILQRIRVAADTTPTALHRAAKLLADRLRLRGDFDGAKNISRSNGEIVDFLACGPFGCYGESDFATAFGPEGGISSLKDTYHGTRGNVSWMKVRSDPLSGAIQPLKLFLPESQGLVYLAFQIKSKSEQNAYLHLDSSASWVLWQNGAHVAVNNQLTAYLRRERLVPVRLNAGWNLFLLKCHDISRSASLAVRLLGEDCRPLENVEVERDFRLQEINHAASKPRADMKKETDCIKTFADAIKQKPDSPFLHAALAFEFFWQGQPDSARSEAEKAVALDEKNIGMLLTLAMIEGGSSDIAGEVRANRRRRHLSKIVKLDPACVPALLELATLEKNDERPQPALKLVDKALAQNPNSLAALRLRLDIGMEEKWLSECVTWLDGLKRTAPKTYAAELYSARFSSLNRRSKEAALLYREARKKAQSRSSLWAAEIESLERVNLFDESERTIEELRRIAPDTRWLELRRCEHFLRRKQYEKAAYEAKEVLKVFNRDDRLYRLRGDALLKNGEREEAAKAYRRSLDISGNSHELRRLVAFLQGGADDFWSNYIHNSGRALKEDGSKRHAGSTVRLIDQTVMEVYPDGSRSETTHELQKILASSGSDKAREVPIIGELLEAKTILPKGGALEPIRLAGKTTLTMPGLTTGAAVEYRFLTDTDNRFDYTMHAPCWFFRSPDSHEEFVLTEYIVRVPEGFPFVYVSRHDAPDPHVKKEDGYTVYQWRMQNMERVWQEEGTPDIREFLPHVEAGAGLNWNNVSDLLANSYLGRTKPTLEMREALGKIIAGAKTDREKVERIFRFVLDHIEPSDTGSQASVILSRSRGEREVLLLAFLKLCGIDARYAALRPGEHILYEPNWELPLADIFTLRAIAVFLPGEEPLWLDCRYRNNSVGTILEDFGGATAFVLDGHGAEFRTLPTLSASAFGETEEVHISFSGEEYSATIKGLRNISGRDAATLKENFREASERTRRRAFERRLGKCFSGLTTVKLEMPGIDKSGTPFTEDYTVEADRMLTALGGNRYSMALPLERLRLIPDPESDPSRRRNPYRIFNYLVREDTIEIDIPQSLDLIEAPGTLVLKDSFGDYHLSFRLRGRKLLITRRYSFTPRFVSLAEWPRLHAIAKRISEAEKLRLVFAKN